MRNSKYNYRFTLQPRLTKEEVYFGGRETFTPWWKRNKVGLETRNKISIKSGDKGKVYKALEVNR